MARLLAYLLALPPAMGLLGGRLRAADAGVQLPRPAQQMMMAAAPPPPPMRCFQVTTPVLSSRGIVVGDEVVGQVPRNFSHCSAQLMDHVFGNSYGHPFVAEYKPPPDCPFGRVVLNLTVSSEGRQFDRLATMWLGDTEIWRTSTAEPKRHPGIVWSFAKDMTPYLALWRRPQTLIFDLGNLVNDKYTGSYRAVLTADFLDEYLPGPHALPADLVLPFSARRAADGLASTFVYPDERPLVNAIRLPNATQRAVVTVAATGQADEEFWWSNVPNNQPGNFEAISAPGLGSFREVRLRIDGRLAGLSWPFPVVFTGGVAPPLHRPLVGLQAFDLREQEIDITPWLGYLLEDRPHNYSLEVVAEYEAVPPRYWLLSAKVFVWLGPEGTLTTGSAPRVDISPPDVHTVLNTMPRKYINYHQTARRRLGVRALITRNTTDGLSRTVEQGWCQSFRMINDGNVSNRASLQQIRAMYNGEDKATEDGAAYYYAGYQYPLDADMETREPDPPYSLTVRATLTQGLELITNGRAVFPSGIEAFLFKLREPKRGGNARTMRSGEAFFYQREGGNVSGGYATVEQQYTFGARGFRDTESQVFDPTALLYKRDVVVVNETVTKDREWVYDEVPQPRWRSPAVRRLRQGVNDQYAELGPRERGAASRMRRSKKKEVEVDGKMLM